MSGRISLEPAFEKVGRRTSAATHGGIWTCEVVMMLIIDDFGWPKLGASGQYA